MAHVDATQNHPPTLLSTYSIYQQLARTDKVKELIIFQTRIRASSKQVIAAIQIDIDEKNPLVKPKDMYNERAAQSRKQLGLFTQVQALIVEFHQQADWYIHYVEDDENCIE